MRVDSYDSFHQAGTMDRLQRLLRFVFMRIGLSLKCKGFQRVGIDWNVVIRATTLSSRAVEFGAAISTRLQTSILRLLVELER